MRYPVEIHHSMYTCILIYILINFKQLHMYILINSFCLFKVVFYVCIFFVIVINFFFCKFMKLFTLTSNCHNYIAFILFHMAHSVRSAVTG